MPMFENLLTQAGGRQSGSPVTRPMSGGSTTQPSQPNYPAPPAPSLGVVGRPSSRPAMPQPPAPVSTRNTTPKSPVASPAAPQGAGEPNGGGVAPDRNQTPRASTPITGGGTEQPQPAPAAPAVAPAKAPQMRYGPATGQPTATLQINRPATRADHVGLLPGVGVRTPYGVSTMGADGNPSIAFDTPESEQRYHTDQANYAMKFGPTPLSNFPGAPQPKVKLGAPAFNPFSGTWLTPNA